MISMKWRADSENSENSALDTFIVSHKIYEKKLFFHRFDFTSSDSPLKQPTGIPVPTDLDTTMQVFLAQKRKSVFIQNQPQFGNFLNKDLNLIRIKIE